MKVALYARVSTEGQIDNFSIPLQKDRMHAYCQSRGWTDIVEYVDPGYTGSNIDRPALQQLIKDLPEIDCVIVYRLDRLSRSQKDTLYLIEDCFLKNNVEFISISETIDTSSPFGRAMIGIMSVFAQLERETITDRLWNGRRNLTKKLGYWSGGADQNPTGYIRHEKGRLEVNPKEAKIVKRIFEEYIKLQSVTKIQKKFHKEGLPVWRYNRIRGILENRLYIGEVTFAGEVFKGSHEPLIDRETFEVVQKLLDRNRYGNYGKTKKHLFTGKMICGHCGNKYCTTYHYDTLKDGTKAKYRYYMCPKRRYPKNYNFEKCYNKTWNASKFDDMIYTLIENLSVKEIKRKKKIVDYDSLIKKIDNKIEKVLDLYLSEAIDKAKLDSRIEELNLEKDELLELKDKQNLIIGPEIRELLDQKIDMRNASIEQQREIVNVLIDKIIINDENIEVVWTF